MDSQEAKAILARYRPGTADGADPDVIAALHLARQDEEMGRWLEQQLRFHETIRQGFRTILPPVGLRERLLQSKPTIVSVPWWQQKALWAAAALILILAGLSAVLWPTPRPSLDRFEAYRARMISTVLREYKMDLVTADLGIIQTFFATNRAPANYVLPPALGQTTPTGAGLINWREKPVSMLCFDRGNKEMLFLFVIARDQVQQPPADNRPEFLKVNKLMTANWSQNGYTYVLAGQADQSLLERYSPRPQ